MPFITDTHFAVRCYYTVPLCSHALLICNHLLLLLYCFKVRPKMKIQSPSPSAPMQTRSQVMFRILGLSRMSLKQVRLLELENTAMPFYYEASENCFVDYMFTFPPAQGFIFGWTSPLTCFWELLFWLCSVFDWGMQGHRSALSRINFPFSKKISNELTTNAVICVISLLHLQVLTFSCRTR